MGEQYPASRHVSSRDAPGAPGTAEYFACEARSQGDVLDAQRLRHRVFVRELGARLAVAGDAEADRFDPFCTHVVVRRRRDGAVVGTYRLLSGNAARRAGGFIAEELFDLHPLRHLRHGTVELGRACVDPEARGGVVLMLLWSAIARYAATHDVQHFIGCASLARNDDGTAAARVCRHALARHLAPPAFRVTPRIAVPRAADEDKREQPASGVLKGYLRMGAWVCGEPAWDRRFDTADLFVLLPVRRFVRRYARHFLERSAAGPRRVMTRTG